MPTTIKWLLAGLLLTLAAQASAQPDYPFVQPLQQLKYSESLEQYQFERATLDALQVSDPLEPFNRRIYHFNYRFDQYVFLPTVRVYRKAVPRPLRKGVSNVYANLKEVPTIANSLLQLKGKRAMHSTARLLFNSIFGVGGLWDVASTMGLEPVREDFGQTLGYYGVQPGPYLMLPFLGPSSVRDTGGIASDFLLAKDINWLDYANTSQRYPELHVLEVVDTRYITELEYGQLNSPFEYEKIRYIYTKARELQILD